MGPGRRRSAPRIRPVATRQPARAPPLTADRLTIRLARLLLRRRGEAAHVPPSRGAAPKPAAGRPRPGSGSRLQPRHRARGTDAPRSRPQWGRPEPGGRQPDVYKRQPDLFTALGRAERTGVRRRRGASRSCRGVGPAGVGASSNCSCSLSSAVRPSSTAARSCEISSEWHGIFHRSGSRICHQMALSRFDAGTSALWLSRSGVPGMHLRSEAPWAPVAPTPRRGVSRTRRWLGSESACCAREPVPFGDKSCCHSREISHL